MLAVAAVLVPKSPQVRVESLPVESAAVAGYYDPLAQRQVLGTTYVDAETAAGVDVAQRSAERADRMAVSGDDE